MLSKAEACILLGNAHELILFSILESVRIREVFLSTQIVESIGVECVGVLVVLGIVKDSQIGSINENASWDASPVFQSQRFFHITFERV